MKREYFEDILTIEELKHRYRKLAKTHHPDLGGSILVMQMINREYYNCLERIGKIPSSLYEVEIGNTVFVNNTACIVTSVEQEIFSARSLSTNREAFFSKATGYAMLNYKYRATVLLPE